MSFYEWFFLEKDRAPAGLFSWSHLLSVTIVLGGFLVLGYFLGKRFKENPRAQRIVLIITAASIILLWILKMAFLIPTSDDIPNTLLENLPLFFCDMMFFAVPIAAFSNGRVRDISFDFIAICGFLMGFMGTYLAGNIYTIRPAISYLSLNSLFGHSLAAFAAIFVFRADLNKMEKRNIPFVIGSLAIHMTVALIFDYITGKNYMFLFGGSGTPFGLILDLVQGNLIIYQIIIYHLQCGYIGVFYLIYYPLSKWIRSKKQVNISE